MPLILGDVNLMAELRLTRPGGMSAPVKERHCEVTDVADTWTCTTWIDLEGEDQDSFEYTLHWEDRSAVVRASKGRLIVDGEPVGTRYIDPQKGQTNTMVDYHRMDEEHCARLEFAKIKTTEQTGAGVRKLGAMAGTVKLELEIGWFIEERYRATEFKRINAQHPLFDARPVNVLDAANTHIKGLTHTSKFGEIFRKPFRPPGSGSRGGVAFTKFVAAPPPFRNGPPGGNAKRPFAEFFWIVGNPDHLNNPAQAAEPLISTASLYGDVDADPYNPHAPYADDYNQQYPPVQPMHVPAAAAERAEASGSGWPSSYGQAASSASQPVASGSGSGSGSGSSYGRTNGNGNGAGPSAHPKQESVERDIKPSMAGSGPGGAWSDTHLTSIDLTLDSDSDTDSDDDEVDHLIMDSGFGDYTSATPYASSSAARATATPAPSTSAPTSSRAPSVLRSSVPPPSEAGRSSTTGGLYTAQEDWLAPASVSSSSPRKSTFANSAAAPAAADPDFPPLPGSIPRPPSSASTTTSTQPRGMFADVARTATPLSTSASPAPPRPTQQMYKVPGAPSSSSSSKRAAEEEPLFRASSLEVEQSILKRPRVGGASASTTRREPSIAEDKTDADDEDTSMASFDLSSAAAWSDRRSSMTTAASSHSGGGASAGERPWEVQKGKGTKASTSRADPRQHQQHARTAIPKAPLQTPDQDKEDGERVRTGV